MRGGEVGDLLVRTLGIYRRDWRLVFALTLPVVLVVDLVTALGLGELTLSYHSSLPLRDAYITLAAGQFVTLPLISAILARWVSRRGGGARAGVLDLLASGLEAFPAVLVGIAIWVVVSAAGFFFLIFPGIYTAVSWYFVAQAVVIDGEGGVAAIFRSAALVRGRWWRSARIGVAFWLAEVAVTALIGTIATPLASAANSFGVLVAGKVVADALTLPFLAIGAALYYVRLRGEAGS